MPSFLVADLELKYQIVLYLGCVIAQNCGLALASHPCNITHLDLALHLGRNCSSANTLAQDRFKRQPVYLPACTLEACPFFHGPFAAFRTAIRPDWRRRRPPLRFLLGVQNDVWPDRPTDRSVDRRPNICLSPSVLLIESVASSFSFFSFDPLGRGRVLPKEQTT